MSGGKRKTGPSFSLTIRHTNNMNGEVGQNITGQPKHNRSEQICELTDIHKLLHNWFVPTKLSLIIITGKRHASWLWGIQYCNREKHWEVKDFQRETMQPNNNVQENSRQQNKNPLWMTCISKCIIKMISSTMRNINFMIQFELFYCHFGFPGLPSMPLTVRW